MNLTVMQIQQLLEDGGLAWRAESERKDAVDVDGNDCDQWFWMFTAWRHDPGRFYAYAKSAVSIEDAARQVYERAMAVLQ